MGNAPTVPERYTRKSGVEALLEITTGQHGFWLVNHKEYIMDILESILKIYGQRDAVKLLNNLDHQIVKEIYKTIDKARKRDRQHARQV